MKSFFFFTTAPNHPGGSGYWEILANDASEAREIMFREKGAQWSFQYTELEQVHEFDRKCHGILPKSNTEETTLDKGLIRLVRCPDCGAVLTDMDETGMSDCPDCAFCYLPVYNQQNNKAMK